MLTFFKYYIDKFEYRDNKYTRIRVNNSNKYINKVFRIWRKERKIRIELTIVVFSKINKCIECFNQILMRKINTIIKNADLTINL